MKSSTLVAQGSEADVLQIAVMKNFAMFTGKQLLESLFIKVTGLQVFFY